ncbi:hypothetical protein GPECTOR_108g178 [Gonium pectorale]|uniref:Uncharacterized protein n=1 Tax=Gonium pectorale TaxID=33097 RepID=A0A150FZE7_GONPE|nr:hypothetical protein GPECTOR_108g178 [Gonium pectorale]|eukprot:KXZ42983.1 hypothetical protein GPECTOR_108g178 [Gonium pectorale]
MRIGPAQMLHVRLEEGRSSRFPLSVPLHNLRAVLAAPDVDALAERTSAALQDRIDRLPAAALYRPASASFTRGGGGGGGGLPASAALSVCRADRGSVRTAWRAAAEAEKEEAEEEEEVAEAEGREPAGRPLGGTPSPRGPPPAAVAAQWPALPAAADLPVAALRTLCATVHLRLAALVIRSWEAEAAAGRQLSAVFRRGTATATATAATAEARQALAHTWHIALAYGKLLTMAKALREGYMAAAAEAHAAVVAGRPGPQGGGTTGSSSAANAGAARESGCGPAGGRHGSGGGSAAAGPNAGGPGEGAPGGGDSIDGGGDNDPWVAALRALDVASSASGGDANMCLATFEALLEARAELLATVKKAVAAAAAAPPPPLLPGICDGGSDGGGGASSRARLERRTLDALVRTLYGLLSETLFPATSRLLSAPASYSPLGVVLAAPAPAAEPSPACPTPAPEGPLAAAARRMGAALARAAANSGDPSVCLDAAERREALRGLLAAYLLRCHTWALAGLGVL